MPHSDLDTRCERQNLRQLYDRLKPIARTIVQVCSVIYEPQSRQTILSCLNEVGVRNSNGNQLTATTLKPYIDDLIAQKLLIQQSGYGPQCNPLIAEIATRDTVKNQALEKIAQYIESKLAKNHLHWSYTTHMPSVMRDLRLYFYQGDFDTFAKRWTEYNKAARRKSDRLSYSEVLDRICNHPFDADWFSTLPQDLYEEAISSILAESYLKLLPAEDAFSLAFTEVAQNGDRNSPFLQVLLVEILLLRGSFEAAKNLLEQNGESNFAYRNTLWGWLHFLHGDNSKAIASFQDALQALRKAKGKKRTVYFSGLSGLFFIFALLKDGSREHLEEALQCCQAIVAQSEHWLKVTYQKLGAFIKFQLGDMPQKDFIQNSPIAFYDDHHSVEVLVSSLCLYWVNPKQAQRGLPQALEQWYELAETAGYQWLAYEYAALLAKIKPRKDFLQTADSLRKQLQVQPLVERLKPPEAWELSLNALASLAAPPTASSQAASDRRLVWFITLLANRVQIQPKEQTCNAQGNWSKGRPIALKRLKKTPEEFSYFTPQDLRVCSQIYLDYGYGYYGSYSEYSFREGAIVELIGHPLVFWEDAPGIRVDVARGEPELLVKQEGEHFLSLRLFPEFSEQQSLVLYKETLTSLKVFEIKEEHRRIAAILGGKNHLTVPIAAKERVLQAISSVSGILTVHSDIGGGVASATAVEADSQPHVQLLPMGDGLRMVILVRPFVRGGPYFRPGEGGANIITEIEGERLQATRNLLEEGQRARQVVEACSALARGEEIAGEWLIQDPEACLELLLELQELGEAIALEWPEGEKLRVTSPLSSTQFKMGIQRQNEWFAASGELQVRDDLVLDLQQLMALLEKSPSRFLPLGDGQFVALTQSFRQRLEELKAFSEASGKGRRFHPLAAFALDEFVDDVGRLEVDKQWQEYKTRLKELETLEPKLPKTLQAELRDYQVEGFNWLSRLAHWGVGACLADDMGLGKTVQALAILLTFAPDGASLIIAPTSVAPNWIAETQKFAPTLNPIYLGQGDRQQTLDQLQPFDLLICSYGLLQQEEVAEKLAEIDWQAIVLDEAQAIKNAATKRSQAAMKLKGKFKLITTGTPIENHLGELWNLFRFINPGLLGSSDSFNQRFANPIERGQDKTARRRLKKLIQPFLLRRTKTQVLDELPSRTEILLQVELSQEETALYEALRRQAIAKLEESDAAAGAKHLQVLAEIMKLRRMCCNPNLVMPDANLGSSKLEVFGEVLEELLENNHKALVFSQFVDHLTLIRAYLDEQNIAYQYLDGSTPIKERKKRVDAFQSGNGDVFLISLKAGGTGLNLTAADYVIHMDPWWNPAVEDQASDRAHRIGQQRPVTIYRLVAKGTIEEKIVQLHHHKRDLADSLLEGADTSGKISTDELMGLIQS